jgi:hypothetical protein
VGRESHLFPSHVLKVSKERILKLPKFLKRQPKLDPNISIFVDILTKQNEKIIEKLDELIELLKAEVDR